MDKPDNMLVIRGDRIGDHIVSTSFLTALKRGFPKSRLVVACPEDVSELLRLRPEIDQIIPFDRERGHHSLLYRWSVIRRLRKVRADLALNTQFTSDKLASRLTIFSGAARRIGFEAEFRGVRQRQAAGLLQAMDQLVPAAHAIGELRKQEVLLKALGVDVPVQPPTFPLGQEEEREAGRFLEAQALPVSRWIGFFTGSSQNLKTYPELGRAVRDAELKDAGLICFGGPEDSQTCAEEAAKAGLPFVNLCGKATLRQAAALLKRCALAVGPDTGLAHIAAAVGCPHVVILGGGDFGRFFPYSPLNSVVCLPLSCYQCKWECPHPKIHCVKDIEPRCVTEAIRQTLASKSAKPRVFMQKSLQDWIPGGSRFPIAWKLPDSSTLPDCEFVFV